MSVADTLRTTQLPSRWRARLVGEKCSTVSDPSIADHEVGFLGKDRSDETRDVCAAILVVGIEVDDHVGAALYGGAQADEKHACEALAVSQPHDVVRAAFASDIRRAVG